MTTYANLQEIIEEAPVRNARVRIIIGGAELPKWTQVTYNFAVGEVPTASIQVPGLRFLPLAVAEEASVEIWFGYQIGVNFYEKLVFGGAVVDSVGNNGAHVTIDCVMDGPRKLTYGYNRRISVDFDTITAEEAVAQLMVLAGVANYQIHLDPWLIGTAVPYTLALGNQLQFSSYGEAINKISEVDGSPWFALPSGQVRVENHPFIPNDTARRTYFTGVLTGPFEDQPLGITNDDARPLIADIQRRKFREQVGNFITIEGAVVVTLGPNGEQNSEQIVETVDGASGQFPNGAFWIPTPPLFQDFSLQNELIDTNAKAFEVAERYFNLKNRLPEELPITVPGDPDVFLCETVEIVDPVYTEVSSLYFVKGYSTTIDSTGAATQLQLVGGPEAGTIGFAAPFAEFWWKYQELHQVIPGIPLNPSNLDLGPLADLAAKICEETPAGTGTTAQGAPVSTDKRMVQITFDGTASEDFDGFIVAWNWSWVDSSAVTHTLSGPRVTILIDPLLQSSVEVTLEVVDNSARTDSITKRVATARDYPITPLPPDPTLDDTPLGGGFALGTCTENGKPDQIADSLEPGRASGMEVLYYIAADEFAMGTEDLSAWNDLSRAGAGVDGFFISVASAVNFQTQKSYGLFGTTLGEVVLTEDVCVTGSVVFTIPGAPRIECIVFDQNDVGVPAEGDNWGLEGGYQVTAEVYTPKYGAIPHYTAGSPGTMTPEEAYQLCMAVGFEPTSATIAVAIMIAESGLVSDVVNTAGNNPPSRDRGIAQINDYYHPEVSDACAFDTECAVRAMYRISSGGTDFTPWATYNGGQFKRHLSEVQGGAEVRGTIGDRKTGTTPNHPRSLAAWLSTSDGRIYRSDDSGRTWELWTNFGDGLPITHIKATPRLPGLWAFGGDTAQPETLVRIDQQVDRNFVSLPIGGDLRKEILANPGFTISAVAINQRYLGMGFSGGVSPRIWLNSDPMAEQDWVPTTGFSGEITALAPGFDGNWVAAGSGDSWNSDDGISMSNQGATASPIHDIVWEGLEGVYLAAAEGDFLKTIDRGVGWGSLRPNATFGTTWPAGAFGWQVSFTVGPRDVSTGDHNGGNTPLPTFLVSGGDNGGLSLSLPYQTVVIMVWNEDVLAPSDVDVVYTLLADHTYTSGRRLRFYMAQTTNPLGATITTVQLWVRLQYVQSGLASPSRGFDFNEGGTTSASASSGSVPTQVTIALSYTPFSMNGGIGGNSGNMTYVFGNATTNESAGYHAGGGPGNITMVVVGNVETEIGCIVATFTPI